MWVLEFSGQVVIRRGGRHPYLLSYFNSIELIIFILETRFHYVALTGLKFRDLQASDS